MDALPAPSRRFRFFAGMLSGCAILLAPPSDASPLLKLQVVSATHMNFNHDLGELVDGNREAGNGLDMDRGQFEEQTIVFSTGKPVSAQVYQFTLWFVGLEDASYPAETELAVTTDPQPSAAGSWRVLKPDIALIDDFAVAPNIVKLGDSTVAIGKGLQRAVLTVRATAPLSGITGFRVRFPLVDSGHVSGQRVIGRAASGSCVLNEFQVEPDPMRSTNIALGKHVGTSGPVFHDLSPDFLTDGLLATFSHPDDSFPAKNFYFQIDLGSTRTIDHMLIWSRLDGTSPERLGEYELQLFDDDGGRPGALLWSTRMHADGSHVPPGGRDIIHQEDGNSANFSGRFVRIVNPRNDPSRPQVAEIEIYPELHPMLASVTADERIVDPSSELPTGTRNIGFSFTVDRGDPEPGLVTFRWRIPSRMPEWREATAHEPASFPNQGSGAFLMEFQARHSDGRWDSRVHTHTFYVPPPWWRQPAKLVAASVATACLLGGLGWWLSVKRLRRKLNVEIAARAVEQDRLRIARDMHDDIGARLTHLALLADRTRRNSGEHEGTLSKLSGEARETLRALDQIVWSVNPRHDTVGSLADYLAQHATEYLADAGISCRLDITMHDRERIVPFSVRHPLLMAVKEALQNIIKHSAASRVLVTFRSAADAISIVITDDGKGLSGMTETGAGHDGLGNMRARLAEAGGRCMLEEAEGGGTRVSLTAPLPSPS